MDSKMPPGLPQMPYKLKTLEEFATDFPVDGPTPSKDLFSTQVSYLLLVIEMLNMSVNDDGLKNMPEAQRKLFVKRTDIYFDEQHKKYFLKEDKLK